MESQGSQDLQPAKDQRALAVASVVKIRKTAMEQRQEASKNLGPL